MKFYCEEVNSVLQQVNSTQTGLTKEESSTLFGRNGKIASIAVKVTLENAIVK